MTKASYKFISYPYECDLGSSTNVLLEHTIVDREVRLHDMLEQYQAFLQAAGYHFKEGDYLSCVNDDDDEETFKVADMDNLLVPQEITRLEVIDEKGRSYVNMDVQTIATSVQDDGRTLKLFVTSGGEL